MRYTCWRPRAREGSRANLTRTLALGARKPDAHLQHSSRRADMAPRAPRGPPTEATLLKRAGQRISARCRRRIDASGGGLFKRRAATALLTTGEQDLRGLRGGFSREISLLARTEYSKLREFEVCPPICHPTPQVCPPKWGAHLKSNNHRPRAAFGLRLLLVASFRKSASARTAAPPLHKSQEF